MRRYGSEENALWAGFDHRDGDIVISTRSKAGTTWTQMIVALLVFQDPVLPAPLASLSPWLDWSMRPVDAVVADLVAQDHRRFIKTHTPLDGLPLEPASTGRRVTYVVVGRHPLDVAVSFFHHVRNLDRNRVGELRGRPPAPAPADEPVAAFLRRWIDDDGDPTDELESLRGNIHHVADAWSRRGEVDVVLVHYADLLDDLEAEMRRLAGHLAIDVPEDRWPTLVAAARFDAMADRASELVPDGLGVIADPDAFFRAGRSGAGAALLATADPDALDRYRRRLADLAPPDVAAWLDR